MNADQLDGILSAISAAPDLEGGLCIGQWRTFDEDTDPAVTDAAIALCRRCPALDACKQWVDSLPPVKRPPGVVAGTVRSWSSHPSRRRKAAAS